MATASYRSDYIRLTHLRRLYSGVLVLVLVLLFFGGFYTADSRNAGGFFDGLDSFFDFPAEVLGEAWSEIDGLPTLLWKYLPSLIETVNIAAVATLIGAIIGLLLSLFSTRGLAFWPMGIPLFRRSMDIMRAVPEIVIALVLIFIMGAGPIPAMIAIAIHTSGALGKLFSEVNENCDMKPVDGLASVGATWGQRMWFGVFPQVVQNYFSYALLRFEINIRASAILGFVGAGGIGYDLRNTISWGKGRYDDATAIFILLFLTIVLVDQLSSFLRNRV
ncbi:MAG: phosphonate ABC transporter, permease protein PhnE [Proteobacteria bacterium TMED51]|nr:MAG: phosphonate ABC transporter, permease protein PhnE [Proteobacteria bacterium TMED51]RPF99675.1 MAG: phosphonate ABC transporter, permease protein PhnE [Proteobacteria bacterium TMED51]